eukprot:Tbor_TRINITY_DN5528_c2_g5::TRINITY_DN5528_c2_g5_i1::g.13111::m.13111
MSYDYDDDYGDYHRNMHYTIWREVGWGPFYFITIFGYILMSLVTILALCAGVFYLADLCEEFSIATRRVLKIINYITSLCIVLLCFIDQFTWWRCLFSLLIRVLYHSILASRNFPYIRLTAPIPMLSIAGFVIDCVMWYYFLLMEYPPFPIMSIMSFMLCVCWAIPLGLFVVLQVEEAQLPGVATAGGGRELGRRGTGFVARIRNKLNL